MCAMQQSYNEGNLNNINFYFLRPVHRFCSFVVLIERLTLSFIFMGEIACCGQFTIKLCVNIILFFFLHATLPLNVMKV